MKLWQVNIERSIFVVADTENDAERIALRNEREECYNDPDFVNAFEVTDIARVPKVWRDDRPYGENGGKTIADILASTPIKEPKP